MAAVKKGDRLVCESCGMGIEVCDECGCETYNVTCCGKPMARSKSTTAKSNKTSNKRQF